MLFGTITQFPSLTIFHIIWGPHACHGAAFLFFFFFFFSSTQKPEPSEKKKKNSEEDRT